MRAFIVRPFGVKSGIDFDRVDTELIQPALRQLLIDGGTTGLVIEAGNIREDMFRLLLVADLVIADISIDNANVYYELGIRQALREKRTFLLRATGMTNDVPFDLKTDRYLPYDPAAPGKTLPAFIAGLEATLAEERQDSPVFKMLPDLREQSRTRFLTVPRDFREEVEYAAATRRAGQLALLGFEAKGAVWESEGLRLVATEQFRARQFEGAAQTYEDFRQISPLDREANLRLATVYQRLGDIPKSLEAQRRVMAHTDAPASDLAEAYSLLGSTLKEQWRASWNASPPDQKRADALTSGLLMSSYEEYLRAFHFDLNHYYSGLQALALVTIVLNLARELPDVWTDRFADEADARRAIADFEAQRQRLTDAVEVSIDAAARAAERLGRPDQWIGIHLADFKFLTASRPGIVARGYEQVLGGQSELVAEAVRRQLDVYVELELFQDRTQRIIDLLPHATPPSAPRRTVLFTGHQIDLPGRPEPRFPADKEPVAREAIRGALEQVLARHQTAVGIAGCASGGDILFHEVCADLGVPTTPYLVVPPDLYVPRSVAPAGPEWVQRFWAIQSRTTAAPVLGRTLQLPGWLRHRAGYSLWQRNNLWLLYEALSTGARNVTLIALWNGQRGDGPGGTSDMIGRAVDRGTETRVLDTTALFNLPSPTAPRE